LSYLCLCLSFPLPLSLSLPLSPSSSCFLFPPPPSPREEKNESQGRKCHATQTRLSQLRRCFHQEIAEFLHIERRLGSETLRSDPAIRECERGKGGN
ncbi:hypothetical protein IE53DRAFT_404984, partial [Violaceomyces palustris]